MCLNNSAKRCASERKLMLNTVVLNLREGHFKSNSEKFSVVHLEMNTCHKITVLTTGILNSKNEEACKLLEQVGFRCTAGRISATRFKSYKYRQMVDQYRQCCWFWSNMVSTNWRSRTPLLVHGSSIHFEKLTLQAVFWTWSAWYTNFTHCPSIHEAI